MRPLALALAAALLLGCSGLLSPFQAANPKLAEPSLFDGGAKASCDVKNTGEKPAPATVSFTLTLADGTIVQADEYEMFDPKEQKPVTHVFEGVRVKDREGATVACSARPAK